MSKDDPTVVVAPAEFRANVGMAALWDLTGAAFIVASRKMPCDQVISVMLSRLARELRRLEGPDAAAKIFRGFADTMRAAEEADR